MDLEVPDNVVFGFLGPNGAGKTTTIKLLTGFACPTTGSANVAGEKVEPGNMALRSKIGFMPDVPAFYDWMTGREFMHFAGELHRLPNHEINERTEELLKLVELKKASSRRIGTYSRGMRQRLGIAQGLINRPQVLFMDEPTSALDPIGRREALELIRSLKQTATIFMSTHILSDVERVCDVVGIINRGTLLTVSSVSDLQKKYARSIFEMEFIEDAAPFATELQRISWLADPRITIENGQPVLRVRAVDVEYARKELPRLVGESRLTLTRYELVLPDLEEIFVSIIGRDK
jgi:ABC-2 type transport system ATP-binding protein